jgi:hypothetical protein
VSTLLLSALALVAVLDAGPSPRTVQLDVVTQGDVRWKGPCKASFFPAGGAAPAESAAAVVDDAKQRVSLLPGKYEAFLECPSTEGVVRKTVPLAVARQDVEQRVVVNPGFLLARVTRGGKDVGARLTVVDEHGREVARGRDRAVLLLAPGKLRVTAVVDDAEVTSRGMLDVVIAPGAKQSKVIDTTDGTLTVALTENGKPTDGIAALRVAGTLERVVDLEPGRPRSVPPGRYDVVTQLKDGSDFHEVVQRDVVVAAGKPSRVVVAHATGMLRARLLDGKSALPASAPVDLQLYTPGADAPFNTIAASDKAKLAPGLYRVVARRTDVVLDDGSAPTGEATIEVRAKADVVVVIDTGAALLDVRTAWGGAPRPLDVTVSLEGAAAPLAKKHADESAHARFALPAGRYDVRAVFDAPQGPLRVERSVVLKRGAPTVLELSFTVGTAVVQAFAEGVAVPAEVRFFADDKDEPVLSIAAGNEAFLPPGKYGLRVRRKGQERDCGELRIAAGRVVERQIDLGVDAAR